VEVEKILNKRKVREVVKYLVQWKRFIAKYNLWKRKEDLKNAKKVVAEFEERKQERLNMVEKRDFRREKLPEKYIAKILYR